MDNRTVAQLLAVSVAARAGFAVTFPRRAPRSAPRWPVILRAFATLPIRVFVAGWGLFREPFESAGVAAKTFVLFHYEVPASLVFTAAQFAMPNAKSAFGLRVKNALAFSAARLGVFGCLRRCKTENSFADYTLLFGLGFPRSWHCSASICILTTMALYHKPSTDSTQRCHLRHDAKQHTSNAAKTRRAKKIDAGQMELL